MRLIEQINDWSRCDQSFSGPVPLGNPKRDRRDGLGESANGCVNPNALLEWRGQGRAGARERARPATHPRLDGGVGRLGRTKIQGVFPEFEGKVQAFFLHATAPPASRRRLTACWRSALAQKRSQWLSSQLPSKRMLPLAVTSFFIPR